MKLTNAFVTAQAAEIVERKRRDLAAIHNNPELTPAEAYMRTSNVYAEACGGMTGLINECLRFGVETELI